MIKLKCTNCDSVQLRHLTNKEAEILDLNTDCYICINCDHTYGASMEEELEEHYKTNNPPITEKVIGE